jgi:glyoxylase-like metal-dependent hydrolase (beta-lactamase superfamily II)
VDTGIAGSTGAIERYLSHIGRSREALGLVVVTHCHVDHTGSLAKLRWAQPFLVAAHEAEAPYIAGRLPPLGLQGGGLVRRIQRLISARCRWKSVPVDIPLRGGSHLDLGPDVRVLHTPGHTPGSICLYLPGPRLLLVGDAISNRSGRLALPPRITSVDMAEARRSVARIAALDVETVCFGHGPTLTRRFGEALRSLLGR